MSSLLPKGRIAFRRDLPVNKRKIGLVNPSNRKSSSRKAASPAKCARRSVAALYMLFALGIKKVGSITLRDQFVCMYGLRWA